MSEEQAAQLIEIMAGIRGNSGWIVGLLVVAVLALVGIEDSTRAALKGGTP